MKHKHDGEHHHEDPRHQTGDSPTNPFHVKLVASKNEKELLPTLRENAGDSTEKPSKWWGISDWWVAIGTCVLAVFAMGSFIQLWIQLNDARKVFNVNQRPWVEIHKNGDWFANVGQPIGYPIQVLNSGKSPAKKILALVFIELVTNGSSPRLTDYSPKGGSSEKAGVMFPSGNINFMSYRIDDVRGVPQPLSLEEQNGLSQGKTYLVVYGHVQYFDSTGIYHWTQFCDWKGFNEFVTYSAQGCTAYNDTDNNK